MGQFTDVLNEKNTQVISPHLLIMIQNPLVSIIVPVYNVDRYLRECLDSLCQQTYKNLEIICVDDGSTDGCSSILRHYAEKDERFVVITQSNAGLAAARNAGLKIASGEWIASVDSDDYVDISLIEKCIQHADSDIDVISFCARRFSDIDIRTLSASWLEKPFSGKLKITETLIPKLLSFFWDKLWRRELIEKSGCYFPEGLIFEDICFSRRVLSLADNVYCLPDKLYHYRKRQGSILDEVWNRKDSHSILHYPEICEICLSFWQKHNIRKRFNCDGPSYLELNILDHCSRNIRQWAAKEFQYQAWSGMRALVDKYGLESRLHEFPDLALYYYLPPYVYDTLRKNVIDSNLNKNLCLFANERHIYWTYRRMQLLSLLTWGKKKRKYKEKKKKYHDLVRLCRQLKRQARELLHI